MWNFDEVSKTTSGIRMAITSMCNLTKQKIQKIVVQDPEIQCFSDKIMAEKNTGCVNQVLLMKMTTKLNSKNPEMHDT